MSWKEGFVTLCLLGTIVGAVPENQSLCDYYTTAIYAQNTVENQLSFITALVNTIFAGNYFNPLKTSTTVPGVLSSGTINGTSVDLAPFFTGDLFSTNRNGKAVAVNFLDDGGVDALKQNASSDGNVNSNQYNLFNHLYQFFGVLLGCSLQNTTGSKVSFPAYQGQKSMYEAHKYMALDNAQTSYFIMQIALASTLFNFQEDDTQLVVAGVQTLFGQRCTESFNFVNNDTAPEYQSICIADDCPLANASACSAYSAVVKPVAVDTSAASATVSGPAAGSSTSASGSGSDMPASSSTGPAALPAGAIAGIVIGGVAAAALVLAAVALLCYRRGKRRQGVDGGRGSLQPDMASASSPAAGGFALNAQNLDHHLASQEWVGIKRDVSQKQTAYLNVVQQEAGSERAPNGRHGAAGDERDGMSDFTELRPQDAVGESAYTSDMASRVYSEEPLTARYAASESVWHPRV